MPRKGHQQAGGLFYFTFLMSFFITNFESLFPEVKIKITVFFSKEEINRGAQPLRYFIEEEGLRPDQWGTADCGYGVLVNLIGQGYLRCLGHFPVRATLGPNGEKPATLLRELVSQILVFFYTHFEEIVSLLATDKIDFFELIKNKDSEGAWAAVSFIEECVREVDQKDTLGKCASISYKTATNGAVLYQPSFHLAPRPYPNVLSFLSILQKTMNRLNNPLAFALFLEYMTIANINFDKFGCDGISKMKQSVFTTNEVVRSKIEGKGLNSNCPLESFISKHVSEYPLYGVAIPELH